MKSAEEWNAMFENATLSIKAGDEFEKKYPTFTYMIRAIQADALRAAGKIAREACLVPPDGGSPSEAEFDVCEEAERRILSMIPGETK